METPFPSNPAAREESPPAAEPIPQLPEVDDLDTTIMSLASANSVHDRTQFETKFDFDLLSDTPGCELKRYEIDTYLFVPNTMGINKDTYKIDEFYADLTHLMRVRTPELERAPGQPLTLPQMAAVDDYLLDSLEAEARKELHDLTIHEIKLLGCFLYTELKKLQQQVTRAVNRKSEQFLSQYRPRLARSLESVHRELRKYRDTYMQRVRDEELLLDSDVRRAFLLVDEYLSYRLESALVNVVRLLKPHHGVMEDVLDQCEALLLGELHYRSEHLSNGNSGAELHYYRLGLLKKFISEVLFLKTERISRDYMYRNAVAALGASLAAAFATLAQIQTTQMMMQGQDYGGWQIALLVCIGVIVYVFKDRIKDLTKDHFNARLKSWLPDYDVHLHYTHYANDGKRVDSFLGNSQEFCRYVSRRTLPKDILYLRDVGHRSELEPERLENVIYYNKRLEVGLRQELREHFGDARVRRIHDVLRFDVSRFLAKLDNPRKDLTYFDPQNGIRTIEAPKVYHVNLVFRYTLTEWKRGKRLSTSVDVERIRLVLNKKGIIRIETVVPRGELGYRE
jgi:hypothetical protein